MKSVKSAASSAKGILWNAWKTGNETVFPAQSQTSFQDNGKLTPAEFTAAGDFLVRTYGTWSWEAGDPDKIKSHMPHPNKQYLITRNVPCRQRATAVTNAENATEAMLAGEDGEDWVAADGPANSSDAAAQNDDDIPTLDDDESERPGPDNDDDVPDIDDLGIEDDEADEAALPASDNITRTRTYDVLVSYDKYHAVPMCWVVGYDENRKPLTKEQIFEDISATYARQTATYEAFPHTSVRAVGIHPCQHAATMRRLANMYVADGGRELHVEHYMVLFLKFIASVVPTIEYDFTSSAGGW